MGVTARPRAARGKEAILFFLAVFYFLIATNTQSGWLFLLSAFLLGLLAICWFPPRRAAGQTSLARELVGSPQRGVPFQVRLTLTNHGAGMLREILVIDPPHPWSAEDQEFRWVVPRLGAGERISTEYPLTPIRRGEHRLHAATLVFGAPFGLFTVSRTVAESEPFLVYPRLLTLSPRRQRTRLAGVLTEFTSPTSKGDSRSLRSLREYQSGDDLRLVHWKSTAKNGGATLLVREHHAPSRQLSLLILDTSSRPTGVLEDDTFEKAVTLTASLLWSAFRSGTRATLLVLDQNGWQSSNRWDEQYTCLARVRQLDLPFADWLKQAGEAASESLGTRSGNHPYFITLATAAEQLGDPSHLPRQGAWLLVAPPDRFAQFADLPLTPVDVDEAHAAETLSHV